jgi:hypothetical protein
MMMCGIALLLAIQDLRRDMDERARKRNRSQILFIMSGKELEERKN